MLACCSVMSSSNTFVSTGSCGWCMQSLTRLQEAMITPSLSYHLLLAAGATVAAADLSLQTAAEHGAVPHQLVARLPKLGEGIRLRESWPRRCMCTGGEAEPDVPHGRRNDRPRVLIDAFETKRRGIAELERMILLHPAGVCSRHGRQRRAPVSAMRRKHAKEPLVLRRDVA
ncbi:hypothetical protein GCM10020219_090820 [Nonomuraea dietziae]